MFHLVSLSLQISLTDLPGPCLGLCVGVACFVVLGGFVVGFFLLGKFDLNHMLIPVVDRPCLALVRQCREKKTWRQKQALFLTWKTCLGKNYRHSIFAECAPGRLEKSPEQTSNSNQVSKHYSSV